MSKEFYERRIARLRAMSPDETRAALKRAGILDTDGHLAARYRPPVDDPVDAAASNPRSTSAAQTSS